MCTVSAKVLIFYYPPHDSKVTSIYIVECDFLNCSCKIYRQLEPSEYRRRYYNDIQERNGRIRIFNDIKISTLEEAQQLIANLWGKQCAFEELHLFVS